MITPPSKPRSRGMLAGLQQQARMAGGRGVHLVQQQTTALAAVAALFGWALFLWQRRRASTLKRQLSDAEQREKDSKAELEARLDAAEQRQLQLEERAQQLEAEAEMGSPTPHAQAQASFFMQLSQLKEDVQQQMAAPPPEPLPKVELVVQEQKLVDLQMELVALQQELQQSCPRPAHGSAQKHPGRPLDLQGLHRSASGNSLPSGLRLPQLSYRSTTSEAALPEGLQLSSRSSCLEAALGAGGSAAMLTSRSCASEPAPPPQLSSRSSCSSRSTTVAEKFQKGLQPLAMVGATESPPGSPDAFKLMCEKEEGEATTWLLDAAPAAEKNGSTYHTPAPGGSPAASYRVQLLGFASPPNRNGAYGAATCGGSTGRKQQAARGGAQQQLSMSMPTSPRVLRRLQSAGGADDLSLHAHAQQAAAAQQPQSAARLAALRASVAGGEALQFSRFAPDGSVAPPGSGDLGVSGPLSRVQQLQRRELPAVSRSLSCLAELRAAAASASASGASTPQTTARLAGSKIPKLPPSHPGTPSAAAGGPVDFKLGTFWSSGAEENNNSTAVSTRATSPTESLKGAAPGKQALFSPNGTPVTTPSASKIPKPFF